LPLLFARAIDRALSPGCGAPRLRAVSSAAACLEIRARGINKGCERELPPMPSLIRFLVLILVLGGIVYVAMLALDLFVEPSPREMTIRVPAERVNQ
jgi:hypothetical protein